MATVAALYFLSVFNSCSTIPNGMWCDSPTYLHYTPVEKVGHALPECVAEWKNLSTQSKQVTKCMSLDQINRENNPKPVVEFNIDPTPYMLEDQPPVGQIEAGKGFPATMLCFKHSTKPVIEVWEQNKVVFRIICR